MKKRLKLISIIMAIIVVFPCCDSGELSEKEDEHHDHHSENVIISQESVNQINLETATVKLEANSGYLNVPAKVIADQDNEALIGSLVQGRVHDVLVKEGDYVKAGQILMLVEGLEIGELKAGYLKALAHYDYTKADLERHKLLLEQNIGSKESFYEAEAEFQKAFAEYQAEDRRIHSVGLSDEDLLNNNEDDHTSGTLPIKSPINGLVVERNVVLGQFIEPATTAFRVINPGTVWIDGQIYEKDFSSIEKKANAVFKTSAYPDRSFSGEVIYIGQVVDEQTRTITVRARFANTDLKLKPQMFGELRFPAGAVTNSIIIPDEALFKNDGENFVFVQSNDTTFEPRRVITGFSDGQRIEIKEGLKEGERIVTKGVFYLKSELKKEEIAGDEH